MTPIRQYSTLLSCIYDEPAAAPMHLGDGIHFSIMRSVEWIDLLGQKLKRPELHDLGVIWDRDHDVRIIDVLEGLYFAGLLSQIVFIGERKAFLTIYLETHFYDQIDKISPGFIKKVAEIVANETGDHWTVELERFDRVNPLPGDKLDTYLRNINNIWILGPRPREAIRSN